MYELLSVYQYEMRRYPPQYKKLPSHILPVKKLLFWILIFPPLHLASSDFLFRKINVTKEINLNIFKLFLFSLPDLLLFMICLLLLFLLLLVLLLNTSYMPPITWGFEMSVKEEGYTLILKFSFVYGCFSRAKFSFKYVVENFNIDGKSGKLLAIYIGRY